MISHACWISLSVGCCHGYKKPVEPNELSAALLKGPAILLMENSVTYYAVLYHRINKNPLAGNRGNRHISE